MNYKSLNKAVDNSVRLPFSNQSKIVFISDCHRGDGTYKDSLLSNSNIYLTALRYYYRNDFTMVELGDGDDLWKFDRIEDIYEAHEEAYFILNNLKDNNRLYMVYGNHDRDKSKKNFVSNILKHTSENHGVYKFYKNLPIYEGVVLVNSESKKEIITLHGHQVDYFNNQAAPISKFLFKHVWAFLEGVLGVKNSISPARSNNQRKKVDRRIINWARENNRRIIIGHTHRTMFPQVGDTSYFNTGCCVLPNAVTSIEMQGGTICLVKWTIKSLEQGQLVVLREIIGGPERISNY